MHYYQFNIGDYIKSTNHLSVEEDITYRRLLDLYYDTEKPIPNDNPRVLRRLRLGSEFSDSLQIVLDEFFFLTDEGWENKRGKEEIESYQSYIAKQKANGSKGGRPKKPTANPLDSQTKPKKSLNTNHKPLTTNHKPSNRGVRFAPPSNQEVGNYFLDRGSPDAMNEADRFIDFYVSKDWMVGKNKMKDWKAAVRNWMRGSDERRNNTNQPTAKQRIGNAIHGSTANEW